MRPGHIADHIKYFLLFFSLQLLLFKNVAIGGVASCFIYVGLLLLLPIEYNTFSSLIYSFVSGLLVDLFYNTHGINAFACLVLAYVRPYVINALTPSGGYDSGALATLAYMGPVWFLRYAFPLIVIHHFIYFMLEAWYFRYIASVLLQTFFSSLFTIFVLILTQLIIQRNK
ncbi:MAG: hypothetical protein NZ529_02745 [Cytophagaceae bacterium]|nr:hypothetical protein [Cytophagaceae bacterium]MDW8455689.1 hypothetical protein [Cytophagaceae bacterium]